MHIKTFLKQAAGVGAANILERIIALAVGVLLARWLGVEGYGAYAFVMAAVSLLLIIVRLGLPELVMRDFAAARATKPENRGQSRPLKPAAVLIILTGMIVYAAVGIGVFFIVEDQNLASAFYVGLLLLPLLSLLDLSSYALRGLGKAVLSQYSAVLLASLLALLSIGFLAFYTEASPPLALGARLVSVFLALCVTAWLLKKHIRAHVGAQPPRFTVLLRKGLPFMMIGSVAVIMSRTDVVMLGLMINPREVGLYNASAQAAMLISLILNTTNTIVAPEFARLFKLNDKAKLQVFAVSTARVTMAAAVPLILLLVVFGPELLAGLFGEEFAAGGGVLMVLTIGFGSALFWGESGFLLNMSGKEHITFRLYTIMAFLNILLNLLLIPLWGALGAALATVAVLNIQRAMGWWLAKKYVGVSTSVLCL